MRRWPTTVSERASRHAGSAIDPAAISRPARVAPPAQKMADSVEAPKLAVPNAAEPMSNAAARPAHAGATAYRRFAERDAHELSGRGSASTQ